MVNIQFDIVALIVGILLGFFVGLIVACAFYKKDYAHGYSDGQDNGWLKNYMKMSDINDDLMLKYKNLANESVEDKRKIVVLEEKLKEKKENV